MTPTHLLSAVAGRLWDLAEEAALDAAGAVTNLAADPSATEPPLAGRLRVAVDDVPDSNALLRLIRAVLGDVSAGAPIRVHGWRRTPDGPPGFALVATHATGRAVLAVTPGGPTVDVVVTPGAAISIPLDGTPWRSSVTVSTDAAWDASLTRGAAAGTPTGTARIAMERSTLTIGDPRGAGLGADGVKIELTSAPGSRTALSAEFRDVRAGVLPEPVAELLGARDRATTPASVGVRADAAGGLRFDSGGPRVELPARLAVPGLTVRGLGLELATDAADVWLAAMLSIDARLPGVPVKARLDGVGVRVPFAARRDVLGPDAGRIDAPLPSGIGVEIALAPVSGGGHVRELRPGSYSGALDVDLGVFRLQAFGLLQLPEGGAPTSLLALLAAEFPHPGIQLGFGFALDAVGGLVGINRRVDVERLRALVSDGHADRVLFPGNAAARAEELATSLDAVFPSAPGRCVVGPMVRISWGARIVTLAGAVVLDLPDPAHVIVLGRLLIALPDPAAPLIRLQANVMGRITPSVPEVELLASMTESWIVGTPVSGEVYLLARGGRDAVFVLSAGGFHPRYVRPAGVPALRRLSMNLGGGFLGLRADAYVAVTSNAVMFGAQLHLDATIAGCGVEGHLGLDALCVYDPTFAFSVRVYASVAVRAFGRRLASVGLDFTLEGPAPWHAFGTGSVSVLFWDASLDFDVRWGAAGTAPLAPPILDAVRGALAAPGAWAVERSPEQGAALRLTARAREDLAKGAAVQADVTLRLSQRVLPLLVPITRFGRAPVPEQTWELADVRLGAGDAQPEGLATESFIPAEFFDLGEHEQLVSPPFQEGVSGVTFGAADVRTGAAHLVDDSYETGYEVEPGFQDADPGLSFNLAVGSFALEAFARAITPTERVARWKAAQAVVSPDALPVVTLR